MSHYVYILKCADGTYYTGYTTDVEKRIKAHNEGRGAKYTRSRIPCETVYTEVFEDKREAMRREWEIKNRFTRKEKEKLINTFSKVL